MVDFEYGSSPGNPPEIRCMVAREFFSGRTIRLWEDQLKARLKPPFDTGSDCLFVAYLASAEFGCFLALNWFFPSRILDLYVEFKRLTSGIKVPAGRGLLGALAYYGIDSIEAAEKEGMRQLALRGGHYAEQEKGDLLDYCQTDVDALARLLPAMEPAIDLPRALLRGRYMMAVARMENVGTPIDTKALATLREHWDDIKLALIKRLNVGRGIYEGLSFRTQRFVDYLTVSNIPWPVLESGRPALDDNTFRGMAKLYPAEIGPIRELRYALSSLRLNDLAVGSDGRNRCMLSPFMSRTGRNQPSNSKFIFGPAVWLRCLIKPAPGQALAYIDYEQQEFGLAAALAGDEAMMEAYRSGDPYLAFARQAGAVPCDATRQSHKTERERFKVCALAVQYGMGAASLAGKLGESKARGKSLLDLHKNTYPAYWHWSDSAEARAVLTGALHSTFGWTVHADAGANPRSLRNFPLQANGAEMLRLACCMATERGIRVCAPIHDALLVEAPIGDIEDVVSQTRTIMREASEQVIPGFPLRTDTEIVRWPERYIDPRGEAMWIAIGEILSGLDAGPDPICPTFVP